MNPTQTGLSSSYERSSRNLPDGGIQFTQNGAVLLRVLVDKLIEQAPLEALVDLLPVYYHLFAGTPLRRFDAEAAETLKVFEALKGHSPEGCQAKGRAHLEFLVHTLVSAELPWGIDHTIHMDEVKGCLTREDIERLPMKEDLLVWSSRLQAIAELDRTRKEAIAEFERYYFRRLIRKHKGNLAAVARAADMDPQYCATKLRKLGVSRDKDDPSNCLANVRLSYNELKRIRP